MGRSHRGRMAGLRGALQAVVAAIVLAVGQGQQNKAPPVEMAVYGSASFKQRFCVGSHEHPAAKGAHAVTMAGGKAELSLHDRAQVAYGDDTRWALYASKGALRSHRTGNPGGIALEASTTRILKDLNVGGAMQSASLVLKGNGNMKPKVEKDAPVLIGEYSGKHLKFGYDEGSAWVQSGNTHLTLNPLKNPVCVGTTKATKKFNVGGGHLRVSNKLFVGGTYISQTHLTFEKGGGWHMSGTNYLRTVNNVPVYTKGAGLFYGNVGVGTLPKFPIFRLQVHGGPVLVTDKADKGLTITQNKEGALIRSWNIDTKKHEGLLIEGAPLLLQPRTGVVLFGTTVKRKNMHLHIRGNLYIHGHMFAMRNLHVKDHAKLKHLLMPGLSLKNKPQSADGDTLVLGHMKKKKESSSEAAPWEVGPKKPVIVGINLRFGFNADYTWIQVHGKDKGHHKPLALNPLGNTVSIGSTKPDKRVNFFAKGNGYVLGTLFVKLNGGKPSSTESTEYRTLETEEALKALRETQLQESQMAESKSLSEFRDSTLSFLSVPTSLKSSSEDDSQSASVHRLTEMFSTVLDQQEAQLERQTALLKSQTEKIAQLQARVQLMG